MLWNPFTPKPVEPKKEYFIVTVLYKSGQSFTGRFSKFAFHGNTWEWAIAPNKKYPHKPMLMGVVHIESVWYKIDE